MLTRFGRFRGSFANSCKCAIFRTDIRLLSTDAPSPATKEWKNGEKKMWDAYQIPAPHSQPIAESLMQSGEAIKFDHIGFRTWNHPKTDVNVFREHLKEQFGYLPKDWYDLPDKNSTAIHFEHCSGSPEYPPIFVRQLHVENLSSANRALIDKLVDSGIPDDYSPELETDFLSSARVWPEVTVDEYLQLAAEDPSAAWIAVFGIVPHHFAIAVHQFEQLTSIFKVNNWLQRRGVELSSGNGGKVAGSPAFGLVQSSTVVPFVKLSFAGDQEMSVAGSYVQFTQRFEVRSWRELESPPELFRGFTCAASGHKYRSIHKQL